MTAHLNEFVICSDNKGKGGIKKLGTHAYKKGWKEQLDIVLSLWEALLTIWQQRKDGDMNIICQFQKGRSRNH